MAQVPGVHVRVDHVVEVAREHDRERHALVLARTDQERVHERAVEVVRAPERRGDHGRRGRAVVAERVHEREPERGRQLHEYPPEARVDRRPPSRARVASVRGFDHARRNERHDAEREHAAHEPHVQLPLAPVQRRRHLQQRLRHLAAALLGRKMWSEVPFDGFGPFLFGLKSETEAKKEPQERKKDELQGARGRALQRAVRAHDGRDALPARAADGVVAALDIREHRVVFELGAGRERGRVDAAARGLCANCCVVYFTANDGQGAEKSELLAVFLASKLRSEDVAKLSGGKSSSFVQGAVGAAASSAVIPHTTRASSLTHALNSGLVPFKEIPVEKLEEFLSGSEGKSVVSDGKTDLLVVRIGSEYTLPETDALIQAASEVLSTATKGSVDFALTGDEADPKQISAPLARRRLAPSANSTASAVVICETGLLVGYSGGKAFCFSHYVHMTPDLLTGLLFGFFFIFLAYVGLSALSAIQTPLQYPSHGPPRGKEF